MTDHKAKAAKHIALTLECDWGEEPRHVELELASAQVHATLALVAEQHTANLIYAFDALGRNPGQWPSEIRDALGLS